MRMMSFNKSKVVYFDLFGYSCVSFVTCSILSHNNSKTISSGIPLPKIVSLESLNMKVGPAVINVSIIDCLRYINGTIGLGSHLVTQVVLKLQLLQAVGL